MSNLYLSDKYLHFVHLVFTVPDTLCVSAAFAGVDPGVNDSGDYSQKSVHASKHGSPVLRKTLFQIMDILIKTKPDDAVYLFMDKKRSEGKPYYVYMTAGANKFLRIYYGRVKEYLSSLPESE